VVNPIVTSTGVIMAAVVAVVVAVVSVDAAVVVVAEVPQAARTSASTTMRADHTWMRFTISPPFRENDPACAGP